MKKILLILLFAVFYTSVNAQCSITATTNASALTCGTAPLSACGGILYIGNGTNAMSLNMNANLDLTCLGAIQFVVRNNATLDFDAGNNKNLQLAAGSSIVFESGSAIKSNNSCSASDLIKIGGSNIASCNGGSATYSFSQIVSQGGYSPINASASPSSICGSGSSTITATATPSAGATYRWYTAATGGTLLQSGSSNTYSTGTISNTTTYYVEAYYASASPAYTTVRKAVTVTVVPTFSLTNVSATATTCTTAKTSQVTVSSSAGALPVGTYTVTYSLSYNSYSTSYTASMSVTTAGTGQFTANLGIMGANNSTTIRVTNLSSGGCSNSISSGNNSNTVNMYSPIKPNITNIYSDYPVCSTSKVQWQNDTFVSGYFLDVATTNTFAAGTYVPGYQDLNVGNVIAYDVTGLTPGTTYYYRVRNNNLGCGISENSDVKSFTTGGIAAPGSITGSATQCPSLAGQVYSTTAVAGANGYSWNVPSGWTITSGWNTTSITVTTGTVGGNVTVAATSPSGGCYSEAKVLAVTMNGATFTTSPSSPICSNVDVTYTTQSGKTAYAWTISGSLGADYTISAGGTTTDSVTLKWLTTGSKTVTVNYSGACSAAATNTVTVNGGPATPGTITQPTNKCAGSTGNIFSIASVTGATSYTWSVTGTGWSVTAGGTTTSATITIGSGVGTVSVTATNSCGTSTASTTGNITPNTLSVAPTGITGTTTICNGASTTLTVSGGTIATGAVVEWFTGSCGGTVAGTGNSITVSPTSNTTYYVRYRGTCNTTSCASQLVTVNTISVAPTGITGTTTICNGASTTLTISGGTAGTGATAEWFTDSCGGTSAGTGNSITVSPTSNTTYYVRYRGTCNTTSCVSTTVLVRATPTVSIGGTATLCEGSAGNITFTNPLAENIAVTYTVNGGAENTVNVGAGNLLNVLTSTAAGTYTYNLVRAAYQSGGGCQVNVSGSAVVTINPVPTAPVIGTKTDLSCTVSTGNVALSGLPAGNWTITTTPATVSTPGSGVTTTITGLAAGNYTFTVTNASGCPSPASASVIISDNSSTTWNGTWSNGTPDATKNVIIASTPYTFLAGFTACALTINSGVVATVPSGVTLTVTNAVTTNGQLIFEDKASLVQINDVQNSGAITYKRVSQPMKNFDYTYWSSPVAGQTLFNLSPNTLYDKYLSYSGTGWKVETSSNVMRPAIGYIIRTPKGGTWPAPYAETVVFPYSQPVQFIGVPNNGYIQSSQTIAAGNYYLVGNPYPCAIDAEAFLYDNPNNTDILDGTIYFWTHNTPVDPSLAQYKYYSADYASYNQSGGTATWYSPGNNAAPNGYIAAGQSFFTLASKPGRVEFNNSMRATGNNSSFFKPAKTSKSAKLEKHRLWLNLTNSGGAFKQTLIGYIEGATNTYDKNFDGISFDGNSYIDFYSVNEAGNLTIQGRALPFTDTDIVPLGYRSTVAGDFTIAIDHTDGNLATQKVYIEDKQTGLTKELTAGNYTFNTKAGTFNNRFVLRYTNKTTLGTGDFETAEDAISILVQNKTVTIDSTVENIDKVFIYDVSGKQLYTKGNIKDLHLIVQNLAFAQQVLLVKIFLENGKSTTRKVVFK